MSPRYLALFASVVFAACSHAAGDDKIAEHAAKTIGVSAKELRVSAQTDLQGEKHSFYLVSRAGVPVLVVVAPTDGELFDSKAPDAFERVTRAEDATENLGLLGAERVALWFAALGGGVCPMPASTDAHFAAVDREGDGVTIRYTAAGDPSVLRTCVVSLGPDGSLRSGRLVAIQTPQAQVRTWRSANN